MFRLFAIDQVRRCLQMFLGVAPGLDTSTDAGMDRLGNLFREQLQIHPDQLTDSQKVAAQGFQNAFTEQLGLVLLVRLTLCVVSTLCMVLSVPVTTYSTQVCGKVQLSGWQR